MIVGKYKLKIVNICLGAILLYGGLSLTGCKSDMPETVTGEENSDGNTSQVTLSFTAEESVKGRASIVEDNIDETQTRLRWDKEDKVTLWMGENREARTFTTQEGGIGEASFSHTGSKVDTKTYFGFYPYQESGDTNITLSLPVDGSIRQEKPNDSKHLAPYRAMYAETVKREVDDNQLSGVVFKPLTSLIVFNLKNDTGEELVCSSVSLGVVGNTSNVFYKTASYVAGSDAPSVSLGAQPTDAALKLSFGTASSLGLSIKANDNMLGFMPLLPSASLENVALELKVETDHKLYTKEFPAGTFNEIKSFETGKFYKFRIILDKEGLIIDNTVIGEWEDGGTIEVPIGN